MDGGRGSADINYPFFSRGLVTAIRLVFCGERRHLMRKTSLSVELSKHT